uniref:Hypotheticial protein n=1 Tax=Schistosoma japonicum TaxID=6182 RepID=C1LE94_SCHJA|nr:hypotheticial protein [Schistosoma japonicum]
MPCYPPDRWIDYAPLGVQQQTGSKFSISNYLCSVVFYSYIIVRAIKDLQ